MIFQALGYIEKVFIKSVKKEASRKDTLYHLWKEKRKAKKEAEKHGWMNK